MAAAVWEEFESFFCAVTESGINYTVTAVNPRWLRLPSSAKHWATKILECVSQMLTGACRLNQTKSCWYLKSGRRSCNSTNQHLYHFQTSNMSSWVEALSEIRKRFYNAFLTSSRTTFKGFSDFSSLHTCALLDIYPCVLPRRQVWHTNLGCIWDKLHLAWKTDESRWRLRGGC